MYPTNVKARNAGSDWVELVWEDGTYCKPTLTSYSMYFVTLKPDNVFEPDKFIQVPQNCTTTEVDDDGKELTVFDSRTYPLLLTLDYCTLYSVMISEEIFGIYWTSNSSSQEFNTEPRKSNEIVLD